MKRIILALAVLVGACAGEDDQPRVAESTSTTAERANETTTTDEVTTTSRGEFVIGDRVETARGNFITLHAYEQPVPAPDEFTAPDAGQEFAAIDIEFCAEVETEDPSRSTYFVGPGDWELQMGDNTRRTFDIAVKEPSMSYADVPVGDCLRGWVSYQVPVGTRPKYLIALNTDPPVRFTL